MSQALYRVWRPQRFEGVVGQEHVTRTLRNALRRGQVTHAYLFAGPRGTGKTTTARLLAKAVNCLAEDPSERPCNACAICEAVNEGRLIDLIEIDAASNRGIDEIRDLREKVGFRPNQARYKVYVIDEVHMLTNEAFNALLKTLEEPPEHVIFVLATTEPHRIPATVLSRCQRFDFHRIPPRLLVGRLREIADAEGIAVEDAALEWIARVVAGSARDAISLLDQLRAYGDEMLDVARVQAMLGMGSREVVERLVESVAARDVALGLQVLHDALDAGVDPRQLARQVVEYLRGALVIHTGGSTDLVDEAPEVIARMKALAERMGAAALLRAVRLFHEASRELKGEQRAALPLELALAEWALAGEEDVLAARSQPEDTDHPRPEGAPPKGRRRVARPRPPGAQVVQEEPSSAAEPLESKADVDGGGVLEVEALRLRWADVLRALRSMDKVAEALLRSGYLAAVEGGNVVVLEFASDVLQSKVEQEGTRAHIEQAIAEVMGVACRVQARVRSSEQREARRPTGREGSREERKVERGGEGSGGQKRVADSALEDDLVEYAVRELEAHVTQVDTLDQVDQEVQDGEGA